MKQLKLKDGSVFDLYNENSGNLLQIKIETLSDWESISSYFTDSNFQTYEIIEEEYTYIYTDKKMNGFNISYTEENGYIVSIGLISLNSTDNKILSLEEKINGVMKMMLNV